MLWGRYYHGRDVDEALVEGQEEALGGYGTLLELGCAVLQCTGFPVVQVVFPRVSPPALSPSRGWCPGLWCVQCRAVSASSQPVAGLVHPVAACLT